MKLVLFAYSRRGCSTAGRIRELFPEAECRQYVPSRLAEGPLLPIPNPSADCYAAQFSWADCMVFVSSCGIAVRQIAPCVRDKLSDPAVVCVDELGRFSISLLSGHVGGANDLAARIAAGLEAVPVITTATDINGRFAVDSWAAGQGFLLDDRKLAKEVSGAVLEGTVPLCTDYPVEGSYPAGIVPGDSGSLGIYVGHTTNTPFQKTLRVIPGILHLGIGCRRGTSETSIRYAVTQVLEENGLDLRAVKCAASIDLKSGEQGLLKFCARYGIPINFYSAEELLRVPGEFTPSAFVQGITGVDNVCERSALIGADTLLVKKTIKSGITVSVAAERLAIRFG